MNLDANLVIQTYQEKISELTHENLMLKAMLKQKEQESAAKEDGK